MKIIQTIKSNPAIAIAAILLLIVIVYFAYQWYKKRGTSSDMSIADQVGIASGPSIDYTVTSVTNKTITFTVKAGGKSITQTANLNSAIGSKPIVDDYVYSVQGNVTAKSIVISIMHVESNPTVHYAVDKTVTVQF